MSGELYVSDSPQDMSVREAIQWGVSFIPTFTPSPTEGTAYVYDVTGGGQTNVTSVMMPSGAASASNGTVVAPLMYGSAGTAGHTYEVVFVSLQGSERGEQRIVIQLRA